MIKRYIIALTIIFVVLDKSYSQSDTLPKGNNNPIIFSGFIKHVYRDYKDNITDIDLKIDTVLSGNFDNLGCKGKMDEFDLRIHGEPIINPPNVYNSDNIFDTSSIHLFALKDTILKYDVVKKSSGKGFDQAVFSHLCNLPVYIPYDSIWVFNSSLVHTNEKYYDHKGQGNDTVLIDLKDKLLPDTELDISLNANKIQDQFKLVVLNSKGQEEIIFDSGQIKGGKDNVRVPLKITGNQSLQLRVISSDKKSRWRVKYRFFNKWLEHKN